MNPEEFRKWGYKTVDLIADYYKELEKYPVKPTIKPGEIYQKLPASPPLEGESMQNLLDDIPRLVIPGMTHWQSPRFFAYFPANSSLPSLIAEMLTAAMGAQCMKWDTSPAATEIEQKVLEWLKESMGLPSGWEAVIQDSASSATLCALLVARERATAWQSNQMGADKEKKFRVYCSTEAHSSIEKAMGIAGLGRKNLVKIPVDSSFRMIPEKLKEAILKDKEEGKFPLCIVAALGTTGSTAIDPLPEIAKVAEDEKIFLHIDAAFAGSALLLPEYRWMIAGIEKADSFVFNPHKWLFTNFDCSAHFIKDSGALIRTFEILPEYLKSQTKGEVNNYADWGVPLGRRFRALKLWFVLRYFGINGIQEKLRKHIELAKGFERRLSVHGDFEILAPRSLNLVCFRYNPPEKKWNEDRLNELNEKLLLAINHSGRAYLTHTKLNGRYCIRMVIGQTDVDEMHVQEVWEIILIFCKAIPNS